MVGHGGSSAGSYLADPTSPIPSHCAVTTLFQSVPVHQLSWLALKELRTELKNMEAPSLGKDIFSTFRVTPSLIINAMAIGLVGC